MPRSMNRREDGIAALVGDAVPLNGVEDQATRRTHMREQTMARQAAERAAARPAAGWRLTPQDRLDAARGRDEALRTALARINAGHQTWLHDHGLTDPLASGPPRPLPADTMAP